MSDKRSYGQGSVYQKKSGIWYLNYAAPVTGKRRRESAFTRKKEEAELLLKNRLVGEGRRVENLTVANMMDDYLTNMEFRQLRWTNSARQHAKRIYKEFGQIQATKLR
ncbi:hypothetical protein C2W62_02370 [Candidatus Entotheonella serta]|nr:hypothetical protein C2W62_02370 [Candidatus Entotheonella serta]